MIFDLCVVRGDMFALLKMYHEKHLSFLMLAINDIVQDH